MKTKIITLLFLCHLGLFAQVTYPYYNSFDGAAQFGQWQGYRKGAVVNLMGWAFTSSGALSPHLCLYHAQPVGATQPTKNWMVSPQFDFSSGGMIDSVRYAATGTGTVTLNDTVAICLLEGSRDPDSATVTLLYDFRDTTYKNDDVWRKLKNISIAPTTQQAYIGFKYVTTSNDLNVRFDNFAVSRGNLSQEELLVREPLIFPNPAHGHIEIAQHSDVTQITLYALDGKKLMEKSLEGSRKIDVSNWNGTVLYELRNHENAVVKRGKLTLL